MLASYGERVQRPGPRDLDPYRIVVSPFELRMGNPDLRPEETHEFELAWEYRKRSDFIHAGLYYKINDGGFDDAASDLGDDVFLYQQQNLVSSRNAGAELEASGQIGKKLSYNPSGHGRVGADRRLEPRLDSPARRDQRQRPRRHHPGRRPPTTCCRSTPGPAAAS